MYSSQTSRQRGQIHRYTKIHELIAPESVEFFSSDAQRLGDKESLEQQLHEITGIPVEILRGGLLENFSLEERKNWMEGRETREEE
ncbi:hypothetical protein BJ875DRAFT_470305 [Amylocarpus encephaloides]|uniref:Uncharacterized protein n=1 Tax=Amylocarpus encephaloides TaxID=45428 RepID=A0A9P7YDN3_9HELO|nr:hypothetical protein BJ875DRAFT_470305 [Amylocarpus encephaloides]